MITITENPDQVVLCSLVEAIDVTRFCEGMSGDPSVITKVMEVDFRRGIVTLPEGKFDLGHFLRKVRGTLSYYDKITLTENPDPIEYYLNELGTDIDNSCQEMHDTVLCPLRNLCKCLQPFGVTQRGRDILAALHRVVERTERMIVHWETKSSGITKTLRGEKEHKVYEEPIAIG